MKNILYAEDNPDDIFILKLAFRKADLPWTLHCVEDGNEAVDWLRGDGKFADRITHPIPDLVILDLKMPRKSGFEVLQWMKESAELKNLPVVVLSSSDDPKDVKRTTELGAARHFRKTATSQELIDWLKTQS